MPERESSTRILIVDDEELILDLLQNYFQSMSYHTIPALDAEEALKYIRNGEPIDLVITDINLPGKSGIDLLRIVREVKPEVPVILITGHKTLDFAISAVKNGASDFITKPFDLANVKKVVEKVLRYRRLSREKERVFEFVRYMRMNFTIPTRELEPSLLADQLASFLQKMGFCSESEYHQYYLAFTETLVNAVEHGNLELSSVIKGNSFDDFANFEKLRDERLKDDFYGNRKVMVNFEVSDDTFTLNITDEGPGFDWRKIFSGASPETLNLESHGRGFVFIRSIMDEVIFNEKGNSITLVKYRR